VKPDEGAKKQVEIYKRMSGKDRLKIAFELWEMAFSLVKASEKALNPELSEMEIEKLARRRMNDKASLAKRRTA
jgi:ABC-type Na+ transport system ATPase subunit NatA